MTAKLFLLNSSSYIPKVKDHLLHHKMLQDIKAAVANFATVQKYLRQGLRT